MKPSYCFILIMAILALAHIAPAQQSTPKPATAVNSEPQLTGDETLLLLNLAGAEMEVKLYTLDPDKNKDKADSATKLANLYASLAQHPNAMRVWVGMMMKEYSSLREGAQSAAQVSQAANEAGIKFQLLMTAQNQLIIEQNKRIIELLDQIAKKR
jgi:hypothetical protein